MNKKLLWIIVAVVVVGGYFWMHSSSKSTDTQTAQQTATPKAAAAATVKPSTSVAKATPTPVTKTYTQLLAEYGTRRIQFNASCQATPSTFVLKNNTSILLDNRANVARTITVDGTAYSLGAYGYQVVSLSSPSLPHTVKINCGSSVNVGTVLLQANVSGE